MKVNLKNPFLSFLLVLISLIHLPVLFASPSSARLNLFYDERVTNTANFETNNAAFLYNVYDRLELENKGLSKKVYSYAVTGFSKLRAVGAVENDGILSIVDFSKPSSEKRLFIIDVNNCKLLFHTYVAHGTKSGKEFARFFSNAMESNKSSLGFYKTADTYVGKHGYSLHLEGLEKGFNDNAYKRDIVMHAANYVNETIIQAKGCIGRSWGCPAVPAQLSRPIIDKIKGGTCLFIFGADKKYLLRSSMLKSGAELQDVAVR